MFIVIEGIDGCGKTTLANRLVKHLRNMGKYVVHTREPGGSEMAEEIRNCLLTIREEEVAPSTEMLLFLASRVQSTLGIVEPALRRGDIVVCERYTDSTIAYQCAGRGTEPLKLKVITSLIPEIRTPDVTIYLHVDVSVSQARLKHSGKLDRMEQSSIDFFNKASEMYLMLSKNKDSISINANQSADDVFVSTIQRLSDYVR